MIKKNRIFKRCKVKFYIFKNVDVYKATFQQINALLLNKSIS